MKFQGDVIITDPMYIIPRNNEDDWHTCEYGENLEALGITTYITHDRGDCAGQDLLDGDLFEQGIIRVKGSFGHDSCMVSVMLLSEVLAYNPNALEDVGKGNYALIKQFDGDVTVEDFDKNPETWECWRFRFRGNKHLVTGNGDD